MRHTPFDPPLDPFISPTDCAQEIGVTDRFIRGEIAAGRLKAIRVSHKSWRTRRSWWNDYLAKRPVSEAVA